MGSRGAEGVHVTYFPGAKAQGRPNPTRTSPSCERANSSNLQEKGKKGRKERGRAKTLATPPSSPSPSDEVAMSAAGGTADFFYRESQRLGYVARSALKVSSRALPVALSSRVIHAH